MKNVSIQIIPHAQQRYDTCGDWWFDGEGTLQIRVSDMGNWMSEQLVAVHEYAEALMCLKDGISEKAVTEFDRKFEDLRSQYPSIIGDMEPGFMSNAPYTKQHRRATHLENQLAQMLDVSWGKHEKIISKLSKE